MTRISDFYHRSKPIVAIGWLFVAGVGLGVAGMYLHDESRFEYLEGRFPIVRAEERAACNREFVPLLSAQESSMRTIKQMVSDVQVLAQQALDESRAVMAYMGERAKVADRNAAVVKQSAAAAETAAKAATQTAEQIKQKVDVAATKATDAASAASAVNKKLDTATRPPLPAQPWVGKRP